MTNKTLKYKSYRGSIEFSEEDNCLFGKILGIKDCVLYEGQNIDELRKDFHESVDDYLDLCKRLGQSPDKDYCGSFNVRISPTAHQLAAQRAADAGISLNQYVAMAVEEKNSQNNYKINLQNSAQNFRLNDSCQDIQDAEIQTLDEAVAIIKKYKSML